MATQDAKTEYQNAKSDIANLLGFFECELGKCKLGNAPHDINWAQVGDMKHIRQNLLETLSFMSGISVDEIEETLDIANL